MPLGQFDTISATIDATSDFFKPEPYKHFPAIYVVAYGYNKSNESVRELLVDSKSHIDGEDACNTPAQAKQKAILYISANYEEVLQGLICTYCNGG